MVVYVCFRYFKSILIEINFYYNITLYCPNTYSYLLVDLFWNVEAYLLYSNRYLCFEKKIWSECYWIYYNKKSVWHYYSDKELQNKMKITGKMMELLPFQWIDHTRHDLSPCYNKLWYDDSGFFFRNSVLFY